MEIIVKEYKWYQQKELIIIYIKIFNKINIILVEVFINKQELFIKSLLILINIVLYYNKSICLIIIFNKIIVKSVIQN
jgi:hypothetical protein